MRNIEPGEELTIDYAMQESYRFAFDCVCKSRTCRKKLTPDDWKIEDLQKRYDGYFSLTYRKRSVPSKREVV
jgi:uncharacterized protein